MNLAYCTNIHPAESWEQTFSALRDTALQVRQMLRQSALHFATYLDPFPLAPRLSAQAASELLAGENLQQFRQWIDRENCEVFTINGFPFGAFHGTRVKENVYRPDWTEPRRYEYTMDLFRILTELLPHGKQGSVSTLPGSFKPFAADEEVIINNLISFARELEALSLATGHDLHLGLEPEPLGHFENTAESIAFFQKLFAAAENVDCVRRRIGINYDTCHFALEFDDCVESLERFRHAGIRISKVHLSAALEINPHSPEAIPSLQKFVEPTYLHQVLLRHEKMGSIRRFIDLPEFLAAPVVDADESIARIHFHIPLDAAPVAPLGTTQAHAEQLLAYRKTNPDFCQHFEIETYTWGVLPDAMQRPMAEQLAAEYRWVLDRL